MHCLDMFNGVAADCSRQLRAAVESCLAAPLLASCQHRKQAQRHPIKGVVYHATLQMNQWSTWCSLGSTQPGCYIRNLAPLVQISSVCWAPDVLTTSCWCG